MNAISYPGVYVIETESKATPIPGIDTVTGDTTFAELAWDLRRTVHQHAPAWTDVNDVDPGVTLVQVLAWLSEALLHRADRLPAHALGDAARFATAATTVLERASVVPGAAVRPRFFSGQLLTPDDLRQELEYVRERQRRHNRLLHGYGIVNGLCVHIETATSPQAQRVVVTPGVALDCRGETIELVSAISAALPLAGDTLWVALRYTDRLCQQSQGGSAAAGDARCALECATRFTADALPLARLMRANGLWRHDATFAPPRARCTDLPKA